MSELEQVVAAEVERLAGQYPVTDPERLRRMAERVLEGSLSPYVDTMDEEDRKWWYQWHRAMEE